MKKVIVDSNIVFSALLNSKNKLYKLFFSDTYKFYTCNFLFVEIFKYRNKITQFSKLTEEELLNQLEYILTKINFVNENIIPSNIYREAFDLCKDVDENDTAFIALTIFLDGVLLTGDQKLKRHLFSKDFKNITSLENL